MNPAPTSPTSAVFTAPLSATGATPLVSVIRALLLLRLRALLGPKLALRFAAIGAGLIAVTFLAVPHGNAESFRQWSLEVFVLKIVPLLCLVAGGSALRDEIRSFTIEYLWTRPASKTHLVVGAYVGTVVLMFAQVMAFLVLIHLVGAIRGIPQVWIHLPVAAGAALGGILAFCALALALGVFSGKYMILGIQYGVLVELGLSRLPSRVNLISVTHHVQTLIESAASGDIAPSVLRLLSGAAGCLVIAAIGVVLAALIFTTTNYRIGDEKES